MASGDIFVVAMTAITELVIGIVIAKYLIRYGINYYLEKKKEYEDRE